MFNGYQKVYSCSYSKVYEINHAYEKLVSVAIDFEGGRLRKVQAQKGLPLRQATSHFIPHQTSVCPSYGHFVPRLKSEVIPSPKDELITDETSIAINIKYTSSQ